MESWIGLTGRKLRFSCWTAEWKQTHFFVRKAMVLLLNTGKSVEEIAAETGFSNRNYFGKVFRHHMGISPSSYRKERQNGAV